MSVNFEGIDYTGRVALEDEGIHLVTLEGISLIEDKKNRAVVVYDAVDAEGRSVSIRTILGEKDEKQLAEAFGRLGQLFNYCEGFTVKDWVTAASTAQKEAEDNWEVLVKHLNKAFVANKTEKRFKVVIYSSWYMGNRSVGVPAFGGYCDKFDGKRLVFNPNNPKHVAPMTDPGATAEKPAEGHEPAKKGTSRVPGLDS